MDDIMIGFTMGMIFAVVIYTLIDFAPIYQKRIESAKKKLSDMLQRLK
jgi:hypothetical protein